MRTIRIKLYKFNELSKAAKQKAINEHSEFLASTPVSVENEDGELEDSYEEYSEQDVIENIEVNDYLFFEDGDLAHCTQYVGKHEKAGTTEFHFHGRTYDITE